MTEYFTPYLNTVICKPEHVFANVLAACLDRCQRIIYNESFDIANIPYKSPYIYLFVEQLKADDFLAHGFERVYILDATLTDKSTDKIKYFSPDQWEYNVSMRADIIRSHIVGAIVAEIYNLKDYNFAFNARHFYIGMTNHTCEPYELTQNLLQSSSFESLAKIASFGESLDILTSNRVNFAFQMDNGCIIIYCDCYFDLTLEKCREFGLTKDWILIMFTAADKATYISNKQLTGFFHEFRGLYYADVSITCLFHFDKLLKSH